MNRLRVFQIILLLLLAAFVTAHAQSPCERGKAALDKGDFLEAVKLLREGTNKDKKNVDCFVNLATALIRADSADAAVGALVQARELDSSNARIYIALGEAYEKQNILTAAIAQWEGAFRLDSANADIAKRIARANIKIRNYNDALPWYVRATLLDTTDLSIFREVGLLYNRAKLTDKALPYLKYVFDRDPKDSSRYPYALGLAETNRWKDFIPPAELILSEDSSKTDLLPLLATAYLRTNDTLKANQVMAKLGGNTANLTCAQRADLIDNYVKLGQAEQAIALYEQAAQQCSTDVRRVYYSVGTQYMKVKDWQKAVDVFDRAAANDTTGNIKFASNMNSAISLMQIKEWENARQHALASIDARADYIPAWRVLAQVYGQLDSTAAARNAYRKMLSMIDTSSTPDRYKEAAAEGYRMEGFYLLLEKKYPASIENFKKALAINPTDCQTLLWTAQAYALSNQRDDAKRYYCRVIANCGKSAGEKKLVEDAKQGLAAMGLTAEDCGK